ncbi:MAG TPA: TfoX/Sxy family protein [Rhizomicrobium sp.]|jgi:DNA transformation protein|nr:TfoX/Sxy family protein [Rhizomicrobium sp.]
MTKGDPDRFDDLFAPFGKIVVRRMFGGEGLFRDGVMFGLVDDERIFLKTSEETRPRFVAEDCGPFTYQMKKGEGILTSYYELPDRLYDDPEELAEWARAAFAVAHTSPTAIKKQKSAARKAGKAQRR